MLKEQTRAVVHMIITAKSRYYQDKLTTADNKETFRLINSLINYNRWTPLPSGTSDQTLTDECVHFFNNKVKKIRLGLDNSDFNNNTACPDLDEPVPKLRSFRVQTQEELDKVIKSCASKTYSLDPIPTALLKNNSVLPIMLPTITDLMNASLSTGIFPNRLKRALVTPRLKKTGLDTNTFSNYRPDSNIPFISNEGH